MPCASPISIDTKAGPINVRCKQCLNCRITKQSALSLRALLEFQTTLSGEFWTLTFADAPENGDYKPFSKFLKRYRIYNHREGNQLPIRFLACGEYGGKTGRFHYHALIYNGLSPIPKASLTKLWPHGFVYIGTVTPASIRYTARYTLKFAEKGREAVASWSTKPPLGTDGMTELAQYMHRRGDRPDSPPTHLKIDGRNYACDLSMRTAFGRVFWGSDYNPSKNLAGAHLKYLLDMKLGDPVARQTAAQEARNVFWETARFTSETL